MGLHRRGEVIETIARLLPAGFHDSQNRLDEAAAARALSAEGQFSPNDGVAERSLADIVRRFHPFDIQECPEPFTMVVQFAAHADQFRVPAELPAQQEAFDRCADRSRETQQARLVIVPSRQRDQWQSSFAVLTHQIVSQAFHLSIGLVDQRFRRVLRCAQHHCSLPLFQYIFARSQFTTPSKASVSSPSRTVARRVVREQTPCR